jgi:stage II sporulation protein D
VVSVLLAAAILSVRPAPAFPHAARTVELEGHGFGHGLGMGLWGAHGMAVRDQAKPAEEIVAYYFPGARLTGLPSEPIRVWLEYDTPLVDTMVTAGDPAPAPGRRVTPFEIWDLSKGERVEVASDAWPFWRVVTAGGGMLQIQRAIDSGGGPAGWGSPLQQVGTPTPGPVEFRPPPGPHAAPERGLLQVGLPSSPGWRYFRGAVQAVLEGSGVLTVNVLPLQEYLYGVMRLEGIPKRWDGPGRQGIRAQTIVARSFALHRRSQAVAGGKLYDLCSTSNCQNYQGWGFVGPQGEVTMLEDPRSSAAVDSTALGDGTLLALVHGDPPAPFPGLYSSSSGGHTRPADNPPLPSVPDPNDAIPENPHHLWRASVPVSSVEAAFREVGSFRALVVIERNGLGDWGGRVTRIRVEGSAGSVEVTGVEIRRRLGLKSDWFRVL